MYHYDLHIVTCGLPEATISVLKSVPPKNNFSHVFTCTSKLLAEDLEQSDIYIYGGPITEETIELLTADKKNKYSYRIVLAPIDKLKMNDCILPLKMDAVWPYPL